MPRHRTAHTSEPPEDDLIKVLPRTSYPTLPTWIDNLVAKINHLVQLLTNADDLPRSAHGWVFLRALRRYDGPAVPGNQDPQTNQIVHSHPFSLTSRNSAIDFTEKVLGGMAAYDRRKRLTLGEAIDHNNKASIVVALTSQLPKRILISIHQPVPRAHLNTVDPIPLAALSPFGVYYCHTTTFERILREGIRPGVHSSRATDPRHIAIKLQASREDTMSREVLTSPLNQRRFSVAIFVAIPSTARSGSQWFWVDIENNIVGTPTIPLESAHFHCALSLDNDRVVHHWLPTATDPRPRGRPIGAPAPVPTNPSTEATMNTNADVRLQLLLQPRNTATPAPAADDIPDATAPPEEEEPDLFDSATNAAFGRLLTALEHPADASPIMDAPLYTVLSRLSHAHPWTSLILDLKDLMPDLDRHYHHQLLVAMLQPNPPHITPFIVVDQFLYCLAIAITNILTPPNSQVDPPEIDSFFFHPTFWHRHLIHGTNLASLMPPWLIPSRVTSSASGAPWGLQKAVAQTKRTRCYSPVTSSSTCRHE